jgi:hypothetical protein
VGSDCGRRVDHGFAAGREPGLPFREACAFLEIDRIAMVAGFGTPLFAFVAFFMALNFHVASGALFK